MIRVTIKRSLETLALLLLLCLFPVAADAKETQVIITQVIASENLTELYISGHNFEGSNPRLQFGSSTLQVTSQNNNNIIAALPPETQPGSYLLRITRRKANGTLRSGGKNRASLSVSLFPPADQTLSDVFSIVNGNVGIGTDNPQALLDVLGKILANELDGPWAQGRARYIRLGDTQIVWGPFLSSSGTSVQETELPAPFLDSSYSVVLTPYFPILFANVIERRTDSFSAQTFSADGVYSGANGGYIAIGRWR